MARRQSTTTDSMGRTRPTTRRSFGTVKQLPSGNYRATYVGPDEQRYAAPQTFTTKGDADAWLAPIFQAVKNGTWKPPSVIQAERFGQYATAWVTLRRNKKGEPLAPKTRVQYDDAVRRGFASFTDARITDITAAVVRKWHAQRCKDSGATQAGAEARILRAILNTAQGDGLIPTNPVPAELCRTKTGAKYRPPSGAELATILDVFSQRQPRLRLAVLLAAFGGLRLSEWRALRRSDITKTAAGHYIVNVERQAQHINGAWIVDGTKGDEARAVTLPAHLDADVTNHLTQHVGPFDGDLLFTSGGKGDFVDTAFTTVWNAARDAAGCRKEVREHDLRHFYGTSLAARGASAVQIKDALGHQDIRTSLGYVQTAKGATAAVADLLAPLPAIKPSNVVPLQRAH